MNAYTGTENDSVGPGCYNPREETIKQKVRIADFATAKIPRKVFESTNHIENNLPNKENPGPGAYENGTAKDKKNFNA